MFASYNGHVDAVRLFVSLGVDALTKDEVTLATLPSIPFHLIPSRTT
jgi:hypothetical protein